MNNMEVLNRFRTFAAVKLHYVLSIRAQRRPNTKFWSECSVYKFRFFLRKVGGMSHLMQTLRNVGLSTTLRNGKRFLSKITSGLEVSIFVQKYNISVKITQGCENTSTMMYDVQIDEQSDTIFQGQFF